MYMAKRSSGVPGRAAGLSGIPLSALSREIERRRSKASVLLRDRKRLATRLAALDAKIARLGADSGRARGIGSPRGDNSSTLAGALVKLLTGNTLSVTEMAKEVQTQGYKTNSPNFRTIVNAALINHPNLFKRVARGQYTAR
jgi:hypothetical protein